MKKTPPKEVIPEALKCPNGWVYEIDKAFKGKEDVPSYVIKGARKVNDKGIIECDIVPNYNHIIILYLGLLCCVSCHLGCQSHPNRKEAPLTLQELRNEAQKIVDSGINEINKRYIPYRYADSLVRNDSSATVLKKLDSLIFRHPSDDKIYLCKGYWYYKRKSYSIALDQYKIATSVARHTYPLLLDREAKAYIGLKKNDSVIQKYKDASAVNTVYYYELANTFELSKNLDSAFYYYDAYFNEYPEDTARKKHWDSLKLTH